jgi:glycosyltransferase involved in cell wall biosynthesis
MAPHLLHVFPSFDVGGAQVRTAALMNRFGDAFRHSVVSLDGRFDCAERLDLRVPFARVDFPARPGDSLPARLWRIRAALGRLRPDRLITSNWGSIEWAMADAWPRPAPLLHMEDGFGPEEVGRQIPRRVWTRRVVLRGARVLLPSRVLEGIARDVWRLPARGLCYVPNGIDLARFTPEGSRADLAVPGEGPLVGTVAALRAEKNIARLLRAAARLRGEGHAFRLAVIGEGPERVALEALAAELGLAGMARFAGHLPDPAAAYRALDGFALSSDTEQMPFSVLEAMGTGLAVASTDVGDVRHMLAAENAALVTGRDDAALADSLRPLVADAGLRTRLGAQNRARAEAAFDERLMAARHEALWRGEALPVSA